MYYSAILKTKDDLFGRFWLPKANIETLQGFGPKTGHISGIRTESLLIQSCSAIPLCRSPQSPLPILISLKSTKATSILGWNWLLSLFRNWNDKKNIFHVFKIIRNLKINTIIYRDASIEGWGAFHGNLATCGAQALVKKECIINVLVLKIIHLILKAFMKTKNEH